MFRFGARSKVYILLMYTIVRYQIIISISLVLLMQTIDIDIKIIKHYRYSYRRAYFLMYIHARMLAIHR